MTGRAACSSLDGVSCAASPPLAPLPDDDRSDQQIRPIKQAAYAVMKCMWLGFQYGWQTITSRHQPIVVIVGDNRRGVTAQLDGRPSFSLRSNDRLPVQTDVY